ncbi:MAG: isoaspartyl peptidase/L-asparaginase [Bacteroidales bacterium]
MPAIRTFLTVSFFTALLLFVSCNNSNRHRAKSGEVPEYVIAIHGGAGTLSRERMTEQEERDYIGKLNEALAAGEEILKNGGSSLLAVRAAIMIMEDSPLFNAGKGAVFTNQKQVELDASVMDGKTLNAGAIAGVTDIRNPVLGAFAVMENSPHVMLAGKGASDFAREQGLEIVENSYFHTQRRLDAVTRQIEQEKNGTVGAVALDSNGNLAAATSTGGMSNKKYGRIGDSPVIGAGTYANNSTCAVSATGHGEFFIRWVVAHDISALMEYGNLTLEEAAGKVINEKLVQAGGTGGVVAVDGQGNVSMPFNTTGMYRGYVKSTGEKEVLIFAGQH